MPSTKEELQKYANRAEWQKAQQQKAIDRTARNKEIQEQKTLERQTILKQKEDKRTSDFAAKKREREIASGFTPVESTPANISKPVTNTDFDTTNKENNKTTIKNDDYSFSKSSASAPSKSDIKIDFNIEEYDKEREINADSISTIDTINNIGSFMNDRILEGVKKSLRNMDFTASKDGSGEENTYTPIAYPTIKLAEELGISTEFADSTLNLHELYKEEIKGVGGVAKKFNERDNSLGDSWVVNPPFQFNPNDDVRSNLSFPNFGRVFNEKITSNYPIVVFEVGTIKYNTTLLSNTAFKANDSDTKLTDRIRGGAGISAGDIIGFPVAMVGTVLRTSWKVLTFPATAILGLRKFARFSVDTALFAKYFNDISQSVATILGLLEPMDIESTQDVKFEDEQDALKAASDVEAIVEARRKTSDIRNVNIEGSYAGIRRRLLFETVVPGIGWGGEESDFIPFLADKDVSISESISNSTQSNPLAANLNAAAAEAAAAKVNNYATGNEGDAYKSLVGQVSSKLAQTKGEFLRGDVSTVISSEGRITLPDMWSDSSFSKSISLNFTFTSPYGHNLSIFENTYIPFLLLFCMTMPRQIGTKTFTNPFFVRVSMKGRFFVPMGIIESLTIDRGEDKNNWTTSGIPRTIKCSLTIKDLSPILMMSMARSKFFSLFQSNDGLTSYINTLGGLSIHDQRDLSEKADRWFKKISERQRSKKGSEATLTDVIVDTFNPFSYAEPIVRGARSTFVGRGLTKLSQAGLNPFEKNQQNSTVY